MQLSITVFYRTAKIRKANELRTELTTIVEDLDVSQRGNFYIYEEVFREKIKNAELFSDGLSFEDFFTFKNFIVGSTNRFAHAASIAVAEFEVPRPISHNEYKTFSSTAVFLISVLSFILFPQIKFRSYE